MGWLCGLVLGVMQVLWLLGYGCLGLIVGKLFGSPCCHIHLCWMGTDLTAGLVESEGESDERSVESSCGCVGFGAGLAGGFALGLDFGVVVWSVLGVQVS